MRAFLNKERIFLPGRRKWLEQAGMAAVAGLFAPAVLAHGSRKTVPHPHIYWRTSTAGTLRTVQQVKQAVATSGISRDIWQAIRSSCNAELGEAPLTCRSELPGRAPGAVRNNNPDYTICRAAGQRVLRHTVALHLTGEEAYKRAAMDQLEALFDASVWPDWIDQSHLHFDLPADLRTGMLSQDTGIAYDWLYPFLDDEERAMILEGIGRRGIRPYLESLKADPWWWHDLNNWYTVIIGGLGIAGMALGDDHPDAARLVEISMPKMREYLGIYGNDGSFNESVAYANSTRIPVAYFNALYYHRSGSENPLAESPFPETADWTINATLPPGRWAAFGDGWVEQPVRVEFMTAIAAATRNCVHQGFAKRHLSVSPNPYELLWFDPTLNGCAPDGKLPLGKAFRENSALVFSRSSWDPVAPAMIVYGKAKRARNHEHNDLGQVCIDVKGKRMITDPGSPSSYPADFFEEARYRYYNASIRGHNVLMLGGREQRHPPHDRGVKGETDMESMNGRFLQVHFDEKEGGYWQMDLTRAYAGARQIRRTVIHLLPGFVAVLDEAQLETEEEISLRWHTFSPAPPDEDGNFRVVNDESRLSGRVECLTGNEVSTTLSRHSYSEPFHLERSGNPLEQRHEPYVELIARGKACRILSLFAMEDGDGPAFWEPKEQKWTWSAGGSTITAGLDAGLLQLTDTTTRKGFAVTL